MNTENSKTNGPHRFRLSLADKINLIEMRFTDKNSEPLEIKDNVNLTLIIELTL